MNNCYLTALSYLAIGLALMSPDFAWAQRQYRCDGVVQYRPCDEPLENYSPPSKLQRTYPVPPPSAKGIVRAASRNSRGYYAKIREQSLFKLPGNMGNWKGSVEGNGQVHLNLRIYRNGSIESTRYMGSVPLKNNDTTFSFKTVLPQGKGWTWKVLAFAGDRLRG